MGGGMVAFFGSTLQMGIETVLDTVGFDKLLEGADMVFSGEGKLDAQSLLGKVVIGVARRAKRAGVPLVAVVGDIGDNIEAAYDMGVSAVFSINRVAVPFREAKPRSKSDLALTMDNLMRFCRRMAGSFAFPSSGSGCCRKLCDETRQTRLLPGIRSEKAGLPFYSMMSCGMHGAGAFSGSDVLRAMSALVGMPISVNICSCSVRMFHDGSSACRSLVCQVTSNPASAI